jgi:glycosyltransferase involved in cell wall biosynthesis
LVEQPPKSHKNIDFDVAVIIPSNHGHDDLVFVTLQICNQTARPKEIIIVDSSNECGKCPPIIQEQCRQCAINLTYKVAHRALPGCARNIGIENATNRFIAFIDVETIPTPDWLDTAKNILANPSLFGVWGKTVFQATTALEALMRDGYFGQAPRRTLPGTVLRKEALGIVGHFVPWVRAGEDSDWMQRIKLSRLQLADPKEATLTYLGLTNQHPISLARKWRRNYSASRALPHLFPQKLLILVTFYLALILTALNWNNLFAGWEPKSILYIPNVTKIVAVTPLIFYLLVRGIILPLRRRVPLSAIVPLRWLGIATICAIGDVAKITAFLLPKKTTPR